MSRFAYYSEPPAVFEGYAGPVVPSHIVYNGFGEPVGAFPLIAALAPLAAQLIGSLLKRGDSSTAGMDGYGEYDGFGFYASTEAVPTQIVYNGFGEPVGAFPFLAALAPLAAKAAGFLAPLAAKAAGAIVPLATKAATAALPLVQNVAAQALPAMASALPQMLTSMLAPAGPATPPPSYGPVAPFAPPAMGPMGPMVSPMSPAYAPARRRRRRRSVRLRRVRPAPPAPGPELPPPSPAPMAPATLAPAPIAPAPMAPPVATDASGGVSGFGWPMAGLHACPRCGGVHGFYGYPY